MSRHPFLIAAAALALGALAGAPSVASAQEPASSAAAATNPAAGPGAKDNPTGAELIERHPPSAARWKILISGISVTGVSYGAMALMGALWEGVPGGDYLYIPIAGPWIALGQSGCGPTEESEPGLGDCEAVIGLRAAIYVVDGLLQLGGLGLVGESIFMTTESGEPAPAKAAILPAPIVTQHTIGFGVFGTF